MAIIKTDYGLTKPPPGCTLDYGDPINRGLVGCWLFNEKSGIRLTDYSGYNSHGTLTNMIPSNWVGSSLGGCLSFDGTNDYVDCGKPKALDISGTLSISIIFKMAVLPSIQYTLFSNYKSDATIAQYEIEVAPTGKISFFQVSSGLNQKNIGSNTNLIANVLYHFVFTRDSSNNLVMYNNGIVFPSTTTTSGAGAVPTTGFGNTTIGRAGDFIGANVYHNGIIDNTRIWNRCLSPAEVSRLYIQPNMGIQSPTYYTQ